MPSSSPSPSRKGASEPSLDDGKKFEFISVSGKEPRGNAATRKKVRSHAQADFRRRHRQPRVEPPRPAMTFELDASSIGDFAYRREARGGSSNAKRVSYAGTAKSISLSSRPRVTSSKSLDPQGMALGPVSPREVMREDMYGLRPGSRIRRSQLLWDHLYDGTCVIFKSMLHIGFIDIVRESTALTQMLSASAWHLQDDHPASGTDDGSTSSLGGSGAMAMASSDNNMSDSARYSVVASRSLRTKLQRPETKASIEVVIAVLAFAAYGALTSDPSLIQIHLDGLCHVLGHRGGLRSIETMPVLRVMIYWIDLTGAYLQDTIPRFAQPYDIIAMRSKIPFPSKPVDRFSKPWPDLSFDPAVSRVCNSLRQLSRVIESESLTRGQFFYSDVLFCPFHISPILHDCLSFPRLHDGDECDVSSSRREFFRLAAMLYITEIRKMFAIDDTAAIVYATKMHLLLDAVVEGQTWSWAESNAFLVWSLVVATTCNCVHGVLRTAFLKHLVTTIKVAGITSFSELSDLVSGVTWCHNAMGQAFADLVKLFPATL